MTERTESRIDANDELHDPVQKGNSDLENMDVEEMDVDLEYEPPDSNDEVGEPPSEEATSGSCGDECSRQDFTTKSHEIVSTKDYGHFTA